ncbi:MAG: D-inositol 3-phosphate glycosyltransferase [Syntrophus sp. SKADARSKE-3]|nr:D-inositol 3-phosphate glycosyltransferase [Syntrophus sp. SKADARSKE-3]
MNDISEIGPQKFKVVHVITRFDKGGSAENTFLTVRDLDKDQYEVWMLCGSSHESQMGKAEQAAVKRNLADAKKQGVHIEVLPELVRSIRPMEDIRALVALFRMFRQLKPHIVHTHTSKAGILGRLAALVARVPIIVHTPHGHVFWGYFNYLTTMLFIGLERIAATFTDRLVMLTEQERQDHLQCHIAREPKFTIIHSGVDFRLFRNVDQAAALSIRNQLSIPDDAFVIGSVGRLTPIKGHRYLLGALAALKDRIPQAVCCLLGDGEMREALEAEALHMGIRNRVFFLGWRPDVAEIMSMFDIFAFPSLNEGMGKVLVEAMALGKPVVASAVGGITNLVTSGLNGILIPPGNAEILADSIELLYRDNKVREDMATKCKAASDQYSSDLMVRKVEDLYSELTAQIPSSSGR